MSGWRNFCGNFTGAGLCEVSKLKKFAEDNFKLYCVYPCSITQLESGWIFMAKEEKEKKLVILGSDELSRAFEGSSEAADGLNLKACGLSHRNACALRHYFPFTAPVPVLGAQCTIGLGDRLGLATAGHIRIIKGYDIKPVFAQQSMRELGLTGRTFGDVLDDASWAVFQEGYDGGFGADGDHLKKGEDVRTAIESGFTMITLDCSEHIDNSVASMDGGGVERKYMQLPASEREKYEEEYGEKEFRLEGNFLLRFDRETLMRTVLTYGNAIRFAREIYYGCIKSCGRKIDFEVSMDETPASTLPQAHYLVASRLIGEGVKVGSLAPRFYGEFQKAVDYIGEIGLFEEDFKMHVAIAKTLGYKLSIHSGSDKFSVYPIIGRYTGGRYHVKTAGTNWLEAVRVISRRDPALFREVYACALEALEDAKRYYHISAIAENIPDIDGMSDQELGSLLELPDARQVLHITYGHILKAVSRDKILAALFRLEEEYCDTISAHIGKHVELLNCPKKILN